MSKKMNYPEWWWDYARAVRNGQMPASSQWNRFAARYRVAVSYGGSQFRSMGDAVADGYSAAIGLTLSYCAFEAACSASGIKAYSCRISADTDLALTAAGLLRAEYRGCSGRRIPASECSRQEAREAVGQVPRRQRRRPPADCSRPPSPVRPRHLDTIRRKGDLEALADGARSSVPGLPVGRRQSPAEVHQRSGPISPNHVGRCHRAPRFATEDPSLWVTKRGRRCGTKRQTN